MMSMFQEMYEALQAAVREVTTEEEWDAIIKRASEILNG